MKYVRKGSQVIVLLGCLVVLGLSCALGLTGCGNRFSREWCDDPYWITQTGDSYSYNLRNSRTGEDSIMIDFNGLYGRDTVWSLVCDGAATVPYEVSVSNLRAEVFRVVLIHGGTGEIETLYENGMEGSASMTLAPGNHTVRIIGYGARGRLHMSLALPQGVMAVDRFSDRW